MLEPSALILAGIIESAGAAMARVGSLSNASQGDSGLVAVLQDIRKTV